MHGIYCMMRPPTTPVAPICNKPRWSIPRSWSSVIRRMLSRPNVHKWLWPLGSDHPIVCLSGRTSGCRDTKTETEIQRQRQRPATPGHLSGCRAQSFIWDTSVRAHCQRPMSKLDMSIVMINPLAVENFSLSFKILVKFSLIQNSYNGVE